MTNFDFVAVTNLLSRLEAHDRMISMAAQSTSVACWLVFGAVLALIYYSVKNS